MVVTDTRNSTPIRTWARGNRDLPGRLLDRIVGWFVTDRHADHGLAVMRIASGSFLLGWLLVNLPIASRIWGPGSAYWQPYRGNLGYKFPFDLLQQAGSGFFWLWYVVTIALVVAFVLGWRTRIVTPLLFIAYTTLNGQNTPISDGGNYFIRIMLIYLILVDVSRRWSLDSRRRAKKRSPETQTGSVLHNIGLCLVVAQICIVYLEAGLYKVQGTLWQNGTAVYYPLQSEAYGVFPPLADLMTHWTFPVVIASYITVLAQIAFPFLLFNKITRRIALIVLLGMHVSIAIAMGLPFFSGIMASADAVLVSGATWIAIVTWLRTTLTGNRAAQAIGARVTAIRRRSGKKFAGADGSDPTADGGRTAESSTVGSESDRPVADDAADSTQSDDDSATPDRDVTSDDMDAWSDPAETAEGSASSVPADEQNLVNAAATSQKTPRRRRRATGGAASAIRKK